MRGWRRRYKAIDINFEEHFRPRGERAAIACADQGRSCRLGGDPPGSATDIETLQGPAALEQKVDTFLDRFNAVVDEFEADPQAAFAEELSGYPFAKPDKLARKIGLNECVQRG